MAVVRDHIERLRNKTISDAGQKDREMLVRMAGLYEPRTEVALEQKAAGQVVGIVGISMDDF